MKGYKVVINLLSTKTCDILVNDVKRLLLLIFCDVNMLLFDIYANWSWQNKRI